MKKIICFGDSNTYGFNPKNSKRYSINQRWTGLLAKSLQNTFIIIEEGCNNRTAFFTSPDGKLQTAQLYLPECLKKHNDFDIFILALGTNDLQKIFKLNKNIAQNGLKTLLCKIRAINPFAHIILIPPVVLNNEILVGGFNHQFDERSIDSSIWIQKIYEDFALQENCEFLDLNKHIKPSPFDGLHFDKKSHNTIAKRLTEVILKIKTQK
ncbi:MAG: GDSL-type esterase/lipase family protein [Candidatus Gastranaerophilales bacterium]|nr:GDSL-type esterase/lipase family protein [Candidatus Gastranaerophilales bacterium]